MSTASLGMMGQEVLGARERCRWVVVVVRVWCDVEEVLWARERCR